MSAPTQHPKGREANSCLSSSTGLSRAEAISLQLPPFLCSAWADALGAERQRRFRAWGTNWSDLSFDTLPLNLTANAALHGVDLVLQGVLISSFDNNSGSQPKSKLAYNSSHHLQYFPGKCRTSAADPLSTAWLSWLAHARVHNSFLLGYAALI